MIVTQSQTNFICPITQVLIPPSSLEMKRNCFIEAKHSRLLSDLSSHVELRRKEKKVVRVRGIYTWEVSGLERLFNQSCP